MNSNIIGGIIYSVLLVVSMFWLFVWIASSQGVIKIERPYFNEYQSCQSDLEKIQEEVKCPEVKVDCGRAGIFYTVVGSVFGIIGMAFFFFSTRIAGEKIKKTNQKKEETNEEEKGAE